MRNYDLLQNSFLKELIKQGNNKAEEVFLKRIFADSLKWFQNAVTNLKFLLGDKEWKLFTIIISEIRANYHNGLIFKLFEIINKLNHLISNLE